MKKRINHALSRAQDKINDNSDSDQKDGKLRYVRTSLESGDIEIYALVLIKTLDVSENSDKSLNIEMIDIDEHKITH